MVLGFCGVEFARLGATKRSLRGLKGTIWVILYFPTQPYRLYFALNRHESGLTLHQRRAQSMTGIIGEFRLGEDIAIALDATAGSTASVSSLSAVMKPAIVTANRFVLDVAASGTAMTVTPQSPSSAGWIIALPHTATASLAAGVYGIDARLDISGSIEMTDQTAFIRLSRATVA